MEQAEIRQAPWWRGATGAAVIAATLAGLVLRLLNARGGLWLDEAWSMSFARQSGTPLGLILHVHHDNNHLLNTLWMQLVGFDAPPMLQRGLSILCGTAAIPVAAGIAARWGRWPAAIAALLFALSPILVIYGSEARGYAPMLLALLIGIRLTFDWIELGDDPARRRWLGWTVFLGALAQLTMAFGLAALIGTAWLSRVKAEGWQQTTTQTARFFWPAALALASVIALTLLPAAFTPKGFEIGSYTPFSWGDWMKALGDLTGYCVAYGLPGWQPTAILLGFGLLGAWRYRHEAWGAFVLLAIVGLPVAVAVLHIGNAGFARYYLLTAVALLLALARLFGTMMARAGGGRWVAGGSSALLILAMAASIPMLLFNLRGDPLRAIAAMRAAGGSATIWVPQARSRTVIESASAAARFPVAIRTAPCPAAGFAYSDQGMGEPPSNLPPACTGARYKVILNVHAYGLSGTDWQLWQRVDPQVPIATGRPTGHHGAHVLLVRR